MIADLRPADGAGRDFGGPADDSLAVRLFPPLPGTVRWGLERTERILAGVGHPHRRCPVLHVGGTNGKGSVARIWAGILRAAGLRTGLYTSPHLVSFRERILVNGRPLADDELESLADELRPLLIREGPSFFEAVTALAFLAFARHEVDVAVVEVGLGGRLDATNVVHPEVTAITNVTLEHADLLGGNVRAIAREKAGILKAGVPAFTASEDSEVLRVLREEAVARGVPLRSVPKPEGRTTLLGSRLQVPTERWGTLDLASPLVGRHQLVNLALAVRSVAALPPRLPVTAAAVREGVLRTRIPGRFQVEHDGERSWIFDVAHNPAGIEALVRTLAEVAPPRPLVAVVGILSDKDWDPMLRALAAGVDGVILTVPDSAPAGRRWDPRAAVVSLAGRAAVEPHLEAALGRARTEVGAGGTILVTGSTHTVGEALVSCGWIPSEALPPSFESG